MKSKTNFDRYLDEQLRDPAFEQRFRDASAAWDVAIAISTLRERAGITQRELAQRAGTTQQQISRIESPKYEGHSLQMLRRIAHALNAELVVGFRPESRATKSALSRQKSKTAR